MQIIQENVWHKWLVVMTTHILPYILNKNSKVFPDYLLIYFSKPPKKKFSYKWGIFQRSPLPNSSFLGFFFRHRRSWLFFHSSLCGIQF